MADRAVVAAGTGAVGCGRSIAGWTCRASAEVSSIRRSRWLAAGAAGAGPDGEQVLEFAEGGVEGQASARAFRSYRSQVQNAWARQVRVTCRCQPR